MAKIETIAVERKGNRVLINRADYSKNQDKLWSDKPKAKAPVTPKPVNKVTEPEKETKAAETEPEPEKKVLKKIKK